MKRPMLLTYEEAKMFGLYDEDDGPCAACIFGTQEDKMSGWCQDVPCDGGLFLSVDLGELSKRLKQNKDDLSEVDKLITQGQHIKAIKLLRAETGYGLRTAKEWCDTRRDDLRARGYSCVIPGPREGNRWV